MSWLIQYSGEGPAILKKIKEGPMATHIPLSVMAVLDAMLANQTDYVTVDSNGALNEDNLLGDVLISVHKAPLVLARDEITPAVSTSIASTAAVGTPTVETGGSG
jgi:hypothetical protein